MQIILSILITIAFFTTNVFAIDTSTDTSKSKKSDKEQSQSIRKSKEQKESVTKRKAKTATTGKDTTDSETIKALADSLASSVADVNLTLFAVFANKIAELEVNTNTSIFSECKVVTNPRLPVQFGLTAEVREGVIDTIKAEYLAKLAQSNSRIKDIADEQAVIAYRNCLLRYGAIVGQAYLYLLEDLNDIGATISKSVDGKSTIEGIGYDDFIKLADNALQRASQNITNSTIKRTLERATNDNSSCMFDKSIENIRCGQSLLVLSAKPVLFVAGVSWYGEAFAGYHANYKLSKAWNYVYALEKLKTTAKYAKFASEVAQLAEQFESEGKVKEAVLVRKKAWELAKSGRQVLSPSKLIPGF